MLREKVFRSKSLSLALAGAFLMLFAPIEAPSQTPATGSMIGFIYGGDMQTPVERAVVKLKNVENGAEVASTPTDKDGVYTIKNIAEGRYILGVTSGDGDFNFEYQLLIKANEMAKLSLALKPGAATTLAGSAQEPEKGKKKPGFFVTPLGIAVLVVGSAVVIYGTYKLLQELDIISKSKK